MCNPVALGVASLALSAVGTAASYVQGQENIAAQERANAYNAQVAQNNATNAEYEAQYAREAAQRNAELERQQTVQLLGRQREAQARSGFVVDSGTFLDLNLDTVAQGNLNELAILHEGDREAYNADRRAQNFRDQSQFLLQS